MRQCVSLSTAVSILQSSNARQTHLACQGLHATQAESFGVSSPKFQEYIFFLLLTLIPVASSHADSFGIMHKAFVISSETSASKPIKSIEFQK